MDELYTSVALVVQQPPGHVIEIHWEMKRGCLLNIYYQHSQSIYSLPAKFPILIFTVKLWSYLEFWLDLYASIKAFWDTPSGASCTLTNTSIHMDKEHHRRESLGLDAFIVSAHATQQLTHEYISTDMANLLRKA